MDIPPLTPEIAQDILRLATVRRTIKQLELEEQQLRQTLTSQLASWPPEAFPLKVGVHAVRVSHRKGRVDYDAAMEILRAAGLLDEAPREPYILDEATCSALGQAIVDLPMPPLTQVALEKYYHGALGQRPVITPEWLETLGAQQKLSPEDYVQCFKDEKPVVPVLMVR